MAREDQNAKWWSIQEDPDCSGCMWYGTNTCICDYMYILGVSRPCPPGKRCTIKCVVAVAEKQKRLKEVMVKRQNRQATAGTALKTGGKTISPAGRDLESACGGHGDRCEAECRVLSGSDRTQTA